MKYFGNGFSASMLTNPNINIKMKLKVRNPV